MMTSSSFKVSKNILLIGDSITKALTLGSLASVCTFDEFDSAIENSMLRRSPPSNASRLQCMIGEKSNKNGSQRRHAISVHNFVVRDENIFNFINVPECSDITGAVFNKQILSFLHDLDEIHAVVIVVNGQDVYFLNEFITTVNNVLTWLPKAAAANLIFVSCDVPDPHLSVPPLQKYFEVINADYNHKFNETLNLTVERLYFIDCAPFNYLTLYRKAVANNVNEPKVSLIDLRGRWETTRYTLCEMLKKMLTLQGFSTNIISEVDAARTMLKICNKVISDFDLQKHKQAPMDAFQKQQPFVETTYENVGKELNLIQKTLDHTKLYLQKNTIFPLADPKITPKHYEMVFDQLHGQTEADQQYQNNNNESNNQPKRVVKGKNRNRQTSSLGQEMQLLFQLKYTGNQIKFAFDNYYNGINFDLKNQIVTVAEHFLL